MVRNLSSNTLYTGGNMSNDNARTFMLKLGEFQEYMRHITHCEVIEDRIEETSALKADLIAMFLAQGIVQTEDPLLEAYRIAIQNQASEEIILELIKLIGDR